MDLIGPAGRQVLPRTDRAASSYLNLNQSPFRYIQLFSLRLALGIPLPPTQPNTGFLEPDRSYKLELAGFCFGGYLFSKPDIDLALS
jgi:hypothetical protein